MNSGMTDKFTQGVIVTYLQTYVGVYVLSVGILMFLWLQAADWNDSHQLLGLFGQNECGADDDWP